MRSELRRTLNWGNLGAIALVLAAAPAWAQSGSSSQQQAPPPPASPTHWGYYNPKPAPQPPPAAPAAKPATPAPPAAASKTSSQGGDISGNRPAVTTATSTSGGGSGGGGSSSQMVSITGINGDSKSLVDQDTQTIKIDDKTTRTTTRIYGQDADGRRQVIAVEQTDSTELEGGKSKSVMTRTDRDQSGSFNLTKREVGETAPSGANGSVTNTTVFTPGLDGNLVPTQQIQQVDRKGTTQDQTTTTTRVPDGNGGWITGRVTDTTVDKQGKDQQTQEQKVFTPDAEGNLALSQRVVTRDWKAPNGQQHEEVDTYAPGALGEMGAPGGGLSLAQRVTTVKTTKGDGTVESREQTEQRSIVSPSAGLQITGAVVEVDRPTKAGPMSTERTIFANDGNNQLRGISVFTGEQPAAQLVAEPPAKPAAEAKAPETKAPEAKAPETKPAQARTPPAKGAAAKTGQPGRRARRKRPSA